MKDMFGTMHVGAIHGRLLTAWSAAGVLGPVLVNYIREYRIGARRSQSRGLHAYHVHHGRIAGRWIDLQPRAESRRSEISHAKRGDRIMNDFDEKKQQSDAPVEAVGDDEKIDLQITRLILFWAFVGVPLIWGVVQTFHKAMQLFE